MDDLERKRWRSETKDASKHPPRRALLAVADDIERGACDPVRHVLIVCVHEVDGNDVISIVQAGELSTLAAEGALYRASKLMGSVSLD